MVSLGHIHKVTAVRQAGRRITAGPHADLEAGGPVNLLTKGEAWHTQNSVRIDVVPPGHF